MTPANRINLASEPFRRNRPILVASAATGVLLLGLFAMLLALIFLQRDSVRETREDIARVERTLGQLAAEQSRLEAVLRQPENAEVLDYSLFLNSLLSRKGISWTQLFADLEEVFPHNVRLISVRPQVNSRNEVLLDMVVGAQTSQPVIQLLMKLEGSPQFGTTSVSNWLPPSQTDPLFRYRVSVFYGRRL